MSTRPRKPAAKPAERAQRRKALARPAKALGVLRKWGVLQLQDASFPNLVALICGATVRGSWWSHPKGSEIFHTAGALADHADVLTTKLISGKVSFVHRRLWPQLIAIGRARESWQLSALPAAARTLLARVDAQERVQASGPPVKLLEERLLVASHQVHTSSGAHAIELMAWEAFARQANADVVEDSAAAARKQLDALVAKMNQTFGSEGTLPWP